jgi:ATP-binding cassette subfamily F protein 3
VKESAKLEERMEVLRRERRAVESELANPALYQGGQADRIRDLNTRQAHLAIELDAAEERWLAVQIELEEIGEP